ncbi:hypothetical protein [Blastochloris viridis]|uniref:Uncharacterized protein n=1 Tax=Blastochloris viridis TaxID=1079 RepID=A0A0H5BEQ8_BLAVI|nr:hypothetical protein [Blastochloris viridis]ALK09421.1 hypothetical protein BVIR_1642 [Blastochloris viridis]BAS00698.1 hypothetical protein BV133_3104 [Blastochloris viridis]CUU42084.1 hypothetical protein BVIRIDIS_10870 [Blastochloris viridis]
MAPAAEFALKPAAGRRNRALAAALAVCWLLALPGPAPAQPDDVALATSEEVLSDRRIAAGYVRAGNDALAAVILERLSTQLAGSTHGGLAAAALTALESGDPLQAADLLEKLAEKLAEQRRDADRPVFADCIRDAKKTYGPLDAFRNEPPDLTESTTAVALSAAAASASAALERCDGEAAPAIAANPDFRRSIEGARKVLEQIGSAVDAADGSQLPRLVTELRGYILLLVFRYG